MAAIDELREELQQELMEWDKIGVLASSTIRFDALEVTTKFNALVQLLVENDVIDEEEFLATYLQRMIDWLKESRPHVADEVAKMRSGMTIPERKLLGPNGEILH
jgi:hypothetical protein